MKHKMQWVGALGALTLMAAATAAYLHSDGGRDRADPTTTSISPFSASRLAQGAGGPPASGGAMANAGRSDDDRKRYIVVLKAPALAGYRGTLMGMRAPERSRSRSGGLRLDTDGVSARRYVAHLRQEQARFQARLQTMTGRSVKPRMTLQHALNGMIVDLTDAEARSIARMPDVRMVAPDRRYKLDTELGPHLIGAGPVWAGTNPGATAAFKGEGVVVGILDTGINAASPSFAAVDPVDGYVHVNPLGSGQFLGSCAVGGEDEGRCNDKLIGGYDFVCGPPENACDGGFDEPGFDDNDSHGSHTASTTAGNNRDVTYMGNTLRISGVAPRANIVAFDVCDVDACPGSALVSAVDQAVADGVVDVINYSISGGRDPWQDPVSLAFLNAVDSGIFIAASAGNSGPGPNTMGHHEPWVSTVAAAQHGRDGFQFGMTVTGPAPVPAAFTPLLLRAGSGGQALTATIPASTPLRVSPGINTTSDGCAPFAADAFAGAIAVVRRGGCTFQDKIANAANAGAVAVLVSNNTGTSAASPSVSSSTIPFFGISRSQGDALRDFVATRPTATAQITWPALPVPNTPDALAAFSSRGPAGTYNILKPDLTAPGVQILAAYQRGSGGDEVGLMSGTSMSSPHVAGAAALVRQARPGWTPSEVASALALTATQTVFLEDQVTLANPFARGSGRIRVDQAIRAGLVMDETRERYAAADPALPGGDPTSLNRPNLYNRTCHPTCVFYRTFRNTTAITTTWRVQLQGVSGAVAPMFTVPANGTARVKFTVYGVTLPPNGTTTFGNVVLTPANGNGLVLRMPVGVAVQPALASLPRSTSLSVAQNAVNSAYFTLSNLGGSNLQYSFVNSGNGYINILDNLAGRRVDGTVSTVFTDSGEGTVAELTAEDFELTTPTRLTWIRSNGFINNEEVGLASVASTLTWSILADADGLPAADPLASPASALWTYTAGPRSTGVRVRSTSAPTDDIELDLNLAGQNVLLPPGRYWLVVSSRSTRADQWHWSSSTAASGRPGHATLSVPPGGGTPVWVANVDAPGRSLSIDGEVGCSTPWISGTYAPSGTLARGTSVQAMSVVYATGLAPGAYYGHVCVQSNDVVRPRRAMALNLTVQP
jgi:subtilisin family serine protease